MPRVEVARFETKTTAMGHICGVLQAANFVIFGLRSLTFALEALSTNQLQGMTPVTAIMMAWLTLTVLFGIGMIIGRQSVMVKYTDTAPEQSAENSTNQKPPAPPNRSFSSRHG